MGVGSEIYGAVINGRRGIGIELKPSYFRQAVVNLATCKPDKEQYEMFDMVSQYDERFTVSSCDG